MTAVQEERRQTVSGTAGGAPPCRGTAPQRPIAVLYCEPGGIYYNPRWGPLDLWDKERDARRYEGGLPVVAHPPCARWCLMAPLVESIYGYRAYEDDGMFAAALRAVRRYGGVLEHPAHTKAWLMHGLALPYGVNAEGWSNADFQGGWTIELAQRHYGHCGRKRTWLYACGVPKLPALPRGDGEGPSMIIGAGGEYKALRKMKGKPVEHMTKAARKATPEAFAELLIDMARSVPENYRGIG